MMFTLIYQLECGASKKMALVLKRSLETIYGRDIPLGIKHALLIMELFMLETVLKTITSVSQID